MEADTLKHIEKLVLEAHGKHLLVEHTPAIILGGEIKTIEHLMAGRSRFRGTFSTSVLEDYADYLSKNPGGHGFIDPDNMRAVTFLNLGTKNVPGHGDWKATLSPKKTAAYAALVEIDGKAMEQRALAEWIEDWSALIEGVDEDGASMALKSIVDAVRDITVTQKREANTQDRDFGASRSALEQIEANSKKTLPSRLIFKTVPYVGFSERAFALRISIVTGEKPRLTLRIVSKEATNEAIADEFKQLLRDAVGEDANLTIGSFTP